MSSSRPLPACPTCAGPLIPQLRSTLCTLDTCRNACSMSAGEMDGIRNTIDMHTADIAALGTSIRHLSSTLTELQQKRDQLEISRVRFGSLLAPIRRLPAELLSEIFLKASEPPSRTNSSLFYTPPDTGIRDRLTLGWVCSRWRNVACHTAALWDVLEIEPDLAATQQTLTLPLLENVWLPRSGLRRLTVDAWCLCFCTERTAMFIQPLIAASHRWRYCRLPVYADMAEFLLEPLELPALMSIVLEDASINDYPTILAFAEAPALRSVRLCDVSPSQVVLPWEQLTDLRIDYQVAWPSLEEFLLYLERCSRLKSFDAHVKLQGERSTLSPSLEHTVLERLLLYTSCEENDSIFLSFLENMTLPTLEEFQLVNCVGDRLPWDLTAFNAFLLRSHPPIRTITLEDVDLDYDVFLQTLWMMPQLEWLSLGHVVQDGAQPLFNGMKYPPNEAIDPASPPPYILPMLNYLSIYTTPTYNSLVHDAIVDMVESRLQPFGDTPARLRTLRIAPCNWSERIKVLSPEWRKAGLDVKIL